MVRTRRGTMHVQGPPGLFHVITWPAWSATGTNPYLRLLYGHLEKLGVTVEGGSPWRLLCGNHDIWHLHWPERALTRRPGRPRVLRVLVLFALLRWRRARGTKIVWTVHNLAPHDRVADWAEAAFFRALVRAVDGAVFLTRASRDQALERYPGLASVRLAVIPHGHYREPYPAADRAAARRTLGLDPDDPVVLFFGQLRAYKNVPHLLTVFADLRGPRSRLLIAGPTSDEALADEIRALAAADPRVTLKLGLVPEDEVAALFAASDLVVLPFRAVLNSGSTLLALSLDRPVLVPSTAPFLELQQIVGPEWVWLYDGALTTGCLEEAIAQACGRQHGLRAPLAPFAWERIAQQTLALYTELHDDVDHARPLSPVGAQAS